MTPEVKATRIRVCNEVRVQRPVGAKQYHNSGDGLIYIRIKIAEPTTWEYEHRVIAQKQLGRALHSWEEVHHKNENTIDKSPDNLVVLTDAEHRLEHGLQGRWAVRHDCCVVCATTVRKHLSHGQCTACYQRLRYTPR